ncbi:hypothetical protein FACS1894153_1170 [Bacteroidia bacterium]|nr:hypothetical protein FACS1894153_1170 [Bacteroidia bacterium]
MTFSQIKDLVNAEIVCGENHIKSAVEIGFASDLMSDVLTVKRNDYVLITGLSNIQTIRTAEMADLSCLIIVRGKQITEEMKELAEENDMIIMKTDFSMFRTVGILYENGLRPMY